jgi:hypothetical protein
MNRIWLKSILGGVLILNAGTLCAQGPGPDGPPFGEPMELLGFEGGHGLQVVKGAPYSATVTSETTHTLSDGTVIHRTSQGALYRDSQGRSRRETTLSGFGPFATSGKTHTMISIFDPVAGAHYMLNAEQKTAKKLQLGGQGDGAAAPDAAQAFQQKMQARLQKEQASGLVKTESLGTQTINGVNAEGTRITKTIPAGQIGNDRAIQVVSERWYSSDLQIVVKSQRSDPQFGTTAYTVTNIQRSEPAASLFTVPADYTVKPGGHWRRHGPPPPPDAAPSN